MGEAQTSAEGTARRRRMDRAVLAGCHDSGGGDDALSADGVERHSAAVVTEAVVSVRGRSVSVKFPDTRKALKWAMALLDRQDVAFESILFRPADRSMAEPESGSPVNPGEWAAG